MLAQGKLPAAADPLAQLVAAGALFKAGRITPSDIEIATETASGQGWRRPLLMWLGVSLQRARAAGDTAAAARIERRIALAAGTTTSAAGASGTGMSATGMSATGTSATGTSATGAVR